MLRLLLSLSLVAVVWCAATVTEQGCFYLGNHYRPGEVVLSEPGCYGRTYTCEPSGIQGHGIPGEDCCTHDGNYYDDGEFFFDSAGKLCSCFGNSVEKPVPASCGLDIDVISG
ncbi:uncharacterized protein LOC144872766 isoform X2 [Branchiostoma floridae x Branchiostoma japonicum]